MTALLTLIARWRAHRSREAQQLTTWRRLQIVGWRALADPAIKPPRRTHD